MPPPNVPRSVGALPPPAPAVNPLSDVTAAAAAAQSQLNNGAFPPTAPLPPPAAHVPYLSAADGSSTHQPTPQQQQQQTPPQPVVAPPAANVSAAADDVNIIQTVTDQDISAFLRGDKEIAFNEDILTEFDEQTAAAAATPAAHDVSKPPCGGAGDASDVIKSDSNVAGSSITGSGFGDAGGGGDVDGSGGGGEITDYKLDLKDWFARIRQAYDDKLHNKNSSSQSESDAVVKVPPPVSINMSARQILASCQNYGRYWIPFTGLL